MTQGGIWLLVVAAIAAGAGAYMLSGPHPIWIGIVLFAFAGSVGATALKTGRRKP